MARKFCLDRPYWKNCTSECARARSRFRTAGHYWMTQLRCLLIVVISFGENCICEWKVCAKVLPTDLQSLIITEEFEKLLYNWRLGNYTWYEDIVCWFLYDLVSNQVWILYKAQDCHHTKKVKLIYSIKMEPNRHSLSNFLRGICKDITSSSVVHENYS